MKTRKPDPDLIDTFGSWRVDQNDWTITFSEGKHFYFNTKAAPSEVLLVECLMVHEGEVVTKDQLLEYLRTDAEPKIIDVHFCKLRRLLPPEISKLIVTVWGRGFCLLKDTTTPLPPLSPVLNPTHLRHLSEPIPQRWTAGLKRRVVAAIKAGYVDRDTFMGDNFINEQEMHSWEQGAVHAYTRI